MTKFPLTYVLLNLLFLFVSCSSDSDNVTSTRLSKKTVEYLDAPDGPANYNFVYENNLLSAINFDHGSYVGSNVYLYENALLTEIAVMENGAIGESSYFTYEENRIISTSFAAGGYNYQDIFTYENGFVIHSLRYQDNVLISQRDYSYDEAGNLEHSITLAPDGITVYNEETYQYDNKKNPYYDVYTDALRKIYTVGPNNVSSITSGGIIQTYSYNYNAAGYPTQQQYLDDSGLGMVRTRFYY